MKKLIILLVVSVNAIAADSNLYLLHINGLNTSLQKSLENVREYKKVAHVSPQSRWDVIYNPTQSGDEWGWVASIKGFIDVCMQKWFGHEELPSLDEITQQKMKALGVDYPIGSEKYKQFQNQLITDYQNLLIDDGGKNMATIIDGFHNVVPEKYASVLQLLANKTSDYSDSKDYVILLPHSQGNIYANNLYKYLTQTERFDSSRISIFGYASPAKSELGQMSCNAATPNYITSSNDGVIELSRMFFGASNVLSSNIEIPPTEVDKTGHGLSEIYLSESYSVGMLNNFINLTSNNCFRDLHQRSYLGELPNITGRIVYDSVSHSIIQVTTANQICEINVDNNSHWSCFQVPDTIAKTTDAKSIATDTLGTVYIFGSTNESDVIIKYSHDRAIYDYKYLSRYSLSGWRKYIDNQLLQYDDNRLKTLSLGDLQINQYDQFTRLRTPIGTPVDYDNQGNIYVAPSVSGYMSTVQVYYQAIGDESSPIKSFATPTQDYILNDMLISNGMIYLCSGTKTYYLPLGAQKNASWNTLPNGVGCNQIIGDDKYLFTTYGGNLYKYSS